MPIASPLQPRWIDETREDSSALSRQLEELVQNHSNLHEVARWALRRDPPLDIGKIVDQDEYWRDIVVELPVGTLAAQDRALYLVYDCT